MGIFDIFTGGAYDDAAAQQRNYLQGISAQQQGLLNQARTTGLADLTAGAQNAVGAIVPAIAQGRTDISSGVDPAISALYGGQNLGVGALTGSVSPAMAALYGGATGGAAAYNPLLGLSSQYGNFGVQAGGATADALGLNGPEGIARAQSQFQTSPGFQFQLGTGLDALTRAANAGGMVASGNTLRNAQTFGSGLAAQEWQNYLKNIQQQGSTYAPLGLSGLGTAATGLGNIGLQTGLAGSNLFTGLGTNLANLYTGTAGRVAPVYTGAAQSLANLAQTGGLATADVYQNEAARQAALEQGLAGTQVGALSSIAGPYASTYGAQAAADTAASGNIWNALLGGAKLAAGGGFLPSGGFTPYKLGG